MFRVTGIPWSRITALKMSLSMQIAEAAWSAPTYGDVRHLQQPLQPAVLAERPVQDRQHDLDPAERGRDLVRRARNRQLWLESSRD